MKVVFVGGGSHRYVGIGRSLLAVHELMDGGEINLYDPAVQRAEAVGRMLTKSPEYPHGNCTVTWGTTLEEALEGADIVFVVLMAGSRKNFELLKLTSCRHGFIASDQLSPSGAMLALKGGPILMDLAQKMERHCPDALLVNFANPVAVLSAAVNNHTAVQCLGVCAGYTNHQWDLTRLLYGKDEQWSDYDIRCAGVNHLSFILPGSRHAGRDLYELAEKAITEDSASPPLSERWNEATRQNIRNSVRRLAQFYRKYGYLVFSSEGDGLLHLDMEGGYSPAAEAGARRTEEKLHEAVRRAEADRAEANRRFEAWLDTDLDEAAWNTERPDALYLLRADEDVMVQIARAAGGGEALSVATSFPNRGAVSGFKDRTVLEYSQVLDNNGIHPLENLEVPEVFQGLMGDLATHQTLLGDAIATRDPRLFFEACYNYPVKRDTADAKALWRQLLKLAADEIPAEFQQAHAWFR